MYKGTQETLNIVLLIIQRGKKKNESKILNGLKIADYASMSICVVCFFD